MGLFGFGKKKKKENEAIKPKAAEPVKVEAPKAPEAQKAPEAPKKLEATKKPEAPKAPEKVKAPSAPAKKPAPKTEAAPAKKPAPKAEAAPAKKPAPKTEAAPAKKPAPKAEAAPAKKPAPKVEEKAEPKKSAVGKFEIKKSKDDRYVFNLYAANKVIVATSQVYSSSTSAMNGIKSVVENAAKAPVEDQTLKSYDTLPYPKWEIYQDKGGQYRFRLNASNGSCICHSQGYTSKASCKNGIESIIRTAKDAEIDKSYLKKD